MSRMRNGLVIGIMAAGFLFLLAATATNVHARGEGGGIAPEGTHLKGPAIHGQFTAKPASCGDPEGCISYSFIGKCKNKLGVVAASQLPIGLPFGKTVDLLTEDDLVSFALFDAGPPQCTGLGGETLVISTATNFTNTCDTLPLDICSITADITLLYAVDYNPNNPVQ